MDCHSQSTRVELSQGAECSQSMKLHTGSWISTGPVSLFLGGVWVWWFYLGWGSCEGQKGSSGTCYAWKTVRSTQWLFPIQGSEQLWSCLADVPQPSGSTESCVPCSGQGKALLVKFTLIPCYHSLYKILFHMSLSGRALWFAKLICGWQFNSLTLLQTYSWFSCLRVRLWFSLPKAEPKLYVLCFFEVECCWDTYFQTDLDHIFFFSDQTISPHVLARSQQYKTQRKIKKTETNNTYLHYANKSGRLKPFVKKIFAWIQFTLCAGDGREFSTC